MISMEIENYLSKNLNGLSEEMDGLMILDSEVLTIFSPKEEILTSWFLTQKCIQIQEDRCQRLLKCQHLLNFVSEVKEIKRKIWEVLPCLTDTFMSHPCPWVPTIIKLSKLLKMESHIVVHHFSYVYPLVLIGHLIIWKILIICKERLSSVVIGVFTDTIPDSKIL